MRISAHTAEASHFCATVFGAPSPDSIERHPRGPVRRSWSRLWNGVSAELIDVRSGGSWHACLAAGSIRLTAVLEFSGDAMEMRLDPGRPNRTGRTRRGQLNLLPPDVVAWEHAGDVALLRRLVLHVDPASPAAPAGLHRTVASAPPRLMFEDARVLDLAALLANECESPGATDDLFGESLIAALLSIVRQHVGLISPPSRGGLTLRHLRCVEALVDGSLERKISLSELAKLTSYSESHFCRAFRATTGSSPHRWILERRVRRAQALLLAGQITLAQIALETGFSDQSHLTRVFGMLFGTTPAAWLRKQMRDTSNVNELSKVSGKRQAVAVDHGQPPTI